MGMGLGCWALVIILAVYTILGFFLVWIGQMVAREEIEIKTGVITLIVSGIVAVLVQVGLYTVIGDATDYTALPVNLACSRCSCI